MDGGAEEMSAGQPKQLILQSNHGIVKSPAATLARFQAGRRWTGPLRSLLSLMRVWSWDFRDSRLWSTPASIADAMGTVTPGSG